MLLICYLLVVYIYVNKLIKDYENLKYLLIKLLHTNILQSSIVLKQKKYFEKQLHLAAILVTIQALRLATKTAARGIVFFILFKCKRTLNGSYNRITGSWFNPETKKNIIYQLNNRTFLRHFCNCVHHPPPPLFLNTYL